MAAGQDYELGGMQLPSGGRKGRFRVVSKAQTLATQRLSVSHDRQRQSAARARQRRRRSTRSCSRNCRAVSSARCACPSRRPARRCRISPPGPTTRAIRRMARNTVCAATRCGFPAVSMSCPTTSCIWCSRRSRAGRQADSRRRRASRFSSCRSTWSSADGIAWRAQRRRAGRPEPQDGLSRHDQLPAEFRRRHDITPDGKAGAIGYLVGEPGTGSRLHVPHDERGAHRRRPGRDDARLYRLPACARLCAQSPAGPAISGAGKVPTVFGHPLAPKSKTGARRLRFLEARPLCDQAAARPSIRASA